MWMTHVKPGRAVSPLISLSPKILTFPPPQLHLVRLTLWTLSLTQTNSYKKSSTPVTHPDHNLHIPVLIFAKIWELTSAVIFPDHFVVFDNVAQIFLIKTLNCHENHLSWSYSSFSHSLLLSCMIFFPCLSNYCFSSFCPCPLLFSFSMSFWVTHIAYVTPNLNGLK